MGTEAHMEYYQQDLAWDHPIYILKKQAILSGYLPFILSWWEQKFTWNIFNPYAAKLIYLNFQPLEVVSRYRDPQPQVVEDYSD